MLDLVILFLEVSLHFCDSKTTCFTVLNQPSDNKRGEKRKNRCKSGDWDGNCGMMRTVDCNLSTV